jgi:hypothetical protein
LALDRHPFDSSKVADAQNLTLPPDHLTIMGRVERRFEDKVVGTGHEISHPQQSTRLGGIEDLAA